MIWFYGRQAVIRVFQEAVYRTAKALRAIA